MFDGRTCRRSDKNSGTERYLESFICNVIVGKSSSGGQFVEVTKIVEQNSFRNHSFSM